MLLALSWAGLGALWALHVASMKLAAYVPLLEPGPGAGTLLLGSGTALLAWWTAAAVRTWLDDIRSEGVHLVAWHGDSAVGHACLLPAGERGHELAIFVRSAYHQARIGTRLLRSLLGRGDEVGVDRVWLTVRRDNVVARNLYESAGFERVDERTDALATDVTMARPL